MRVLVLEDDEQFRDLLVKGLRSRAFAVDAAGTVAEARALLLEFMGAYDAAVFDLMLPDGSPLDLLRECADDGYPLSAMMLSAHDDDESRVAALRAGALDFVAKPVRMKELSLRVQHLVSRSPDQPIALPIELAGVVLDRARHLVFINGQDASLTPTQYRVFSYLMVNRDRLVPMQELIDHCWDQHTDLFSNPIHSHISRLRAIFTGELNLVHDHGGYRVEPADGPTPPSVP